nr:MAG TPA_asm: LAGLIDADG-like domain [Caudoviricetes sp.]
MYRLLLSDKDLITNIERFGIIEHKTDIIPAPSLLPEEEKYIPYIIRGIIDGDGTFDIRNNTIGMRVATKSKVFAEWIKTVLEEKMFF